MHCTPCTQGCCFSGSNDDLLCSPESSELQSDEPVSFFQGLKLVMNHGAYIKLIAGFLFTSLAFMVSTAGLEGLGRGNSSSTAWRWLGGKQRRAQRGSQRAGSM